MTGFGGGTASAGAQNDGLWRRHSLCEGSERQTSGKEVPLPTPNMSFWAAESREESRIRCIGIHAEQITGALVL